MHGAEEGHESPVKIITLDGFGSEGNNGVRNSALIGGRLIFGTSTYSALDDSDSVARGGYEYFEVRDSGGNSGQEGEGASSGGCSRGRLFGCGFGGSAAGMRGRFLCPLFHIREGRSGLKKSA